MYSVVANDELVELEAFIQKKQEEDAKLINKIYCESFGPAVYRRVKEEKTRLCDTCHRLSGWTPTPLNGGAHVCQRSACNIVQMHQGEIYEILRYADSIDCWNRFILGIHACCCSRGVIVYPMRMHEINKQTK